MSANATAAEFSADPRMKWFHDARYGMIVHYGLYSLLERGEWVLNRERIPKEEYAQLASRFTCEKFNAKELCALAVRAGMRYIVFTTMHHDGFCLYDTKLTKFNSMQTAAHRDLTAEIVAAAREAGLRIGLYHSLNNWFQDPDSVAALESPQHYDTFIKNTHDRIRELVTRYAPFDVMWYDGWWPFNAEGWQSEKMNAMVRSIQPHIIFNGRNALPGDFATPEGHLSAPSPWRPWEAALTLNANWGYHRGDHAWKSATEVVSMLGTTASRGGNLLLNMGPRGDGSLPPESVKILETVGEWLACNGECIFGAEPFTFALRERGNHRGDWFPHGPLTCKGNALYLLVLRWPGPAFAVAGFECGVKKATILGTNKAIDFRMRENVVEFSGLPEQPPDPVCTVIRLDCDRPPVLHHCGGMRLPKAPHPPYDPVQSDIQL